MKYLKQILLIAITFVAFLSSSAMALDLVREELRMDEVLANYGVTGDGVVVVIIDRGIDYRHPDFIKPNGNSRIRWIYDMTGQNDCSGNVIPVEYSQQQINAALEGGAEVPSYDRVGHGTATAGSAAGNGRALADKRYTGLAPNAELIIIKHTSEGAPARERLPAEAPFVSCLVEAFEWLDEKLRILGLPAVAVINSGVQWGPQDGTSLVSQLIDEQFGNTPGRIMVIPSGDEGTLPSHSGGDFDAAVVSNVQFNKTSNASTPLTAWYSGEVPAEVTITFDSGATASALPGESIFQDDIRIINYTPGTEFWSWQNTGGDRAVYVNLGPNMGTGQIGFKALDAHNGTGHFDVYSDVAGPNLTTVTELLDHLVPGRLTDYASTRSAIVAADSVIRTFYTDINGQSRGTNEEGEPGELWLKSGRGPSRDGRTYGVDVTLPGEGSFVPLSQHSSWKDIPGAQPESGEGLYIRFGGTSGSSPLLTGVVALMLELKPTLTHEEVRNLLRSSAIADANTGALPNAEWGFGKTDVMAALEPLKGTPVIAAHSASWFDFSHNGEGWLLEILAAETINDDGTTKPGVALVYWFTYPPNFDQGQQSWVVALGSISGDTITFDEALMPVGGIFGPDFDPDSVVLEPWGSFVFRFLSCDAGVMTYKGPRGWGNGFLNLTRLSAPAGLDCVEAAQNTVQSSTGRQQKIKMETPATHPGFSASWYDPSHDGEGWLIEILSAELALVYWFTYDTTGRQTWLTNVGTINGNSITVDLLMPVGPEFGIDFDPDSVELVDWGTAVFEFTDCNNGSMSYESRLEEYGSGTLSLVRLSTRLDLACP